MNFTDSVVVDDVRVTRDNYLVANCRIARSGCQTYAGHELGMPDREKVVLWRSPQEVFAGDALASWCFKPISIGHPEQMIDSGSWRDHACGFSSGDVGVDGSYIKLPMMIADKEAVSLIESGVKELSCGYLADIDMTPGVTPEGEHYDGQMKNLRGNHIAIVERARGGSQLRIPTRDAAGDTGSGDARQSYLDYLRDAHRGDQPAVRRADPAATFEASARAAEAANQRIIGRRPDAGAGYSELKARLADAWRAA